jgi:uncharacterized RDD family membrane protein YckC
MIKTGVGFGPRLVAYLIDGIILSVLTSGTGYSFNAGSGPSMPFSFGSGLVINGLYFVLLWTYWNGQTVGKRLMNLKVVKEDGSPIDLQTAILRYVGYIISGCVIGLGFLWVIWDSKKQGWHDKIAKTFVVKV